MSGSRPENVNSLGDFASDYKIKYQISEGNFSYVWMCVQRDNGHKYAAKILKKSYGNSVNMDDWKNIAEVKVARSFLKHPFLLMLERVYHECSEPGRVIMVSDMMNRTLYDVIGAGECPLQEKRVKSYTYQLLEGLKYIHKNGFIHRDINPKNILLKDKTLKVGDFGTACNVTTGQPYTPYLAKLWYRSPESLLTTDWYNTKMDIWSAGCVLHEMATGRPLFGGQDEHDQVNKIDRILGSPDVRSVSNFKKRSSEIFDQQYNGTAAGTGVRGIGLHAVHKPFRATYDVLKDMVAYNPFKRFSADRLLRKPYFLDMRNTEHERKVKTFEKTAIRTSKPLTEKNSSGDDWKSSAPKRMPLPDKNHERGDHEQQSNRKRCPVPKIEHGRQPHNRIENRKPVHGNTIASGIKQEQAKSKTTMVLKGNAKNSLTLDKQCTRPIPMMNNRIPLRKACVTNGKLLNRPPFK